MGRPRKQDGYLREEGGSWLGTWRVYRGTNKSARRTVDVTRNAGKFDILAAVHANGTIEYSTHNGLGLPKVFLTKPDTELTSTGVESVN